jgi:hypothetical protein
MRPLHEAYYVVYLTRSIGRAGPPMSMIISMCNIMYLLQYKYCTRRCIMRRLAGADS